MYDEPYWFEESGTGKNGMGWERTRKRSGTIISCRQYVNLGGYRDELRPISASE